MRNGGAGAATWNASRSRGRAAWADAARSARVGRIIALSHLGADKASAYHLHRAKGRVEQLLRESGLATTIIRSGLVYGPDDAFVNHIASMLRGNPIFFFMPRPRRSGAASDLY